MITAMRLGFRSLATFKISSLLRFESGVRVIGLNLIKKVVPEIGNLIEQHSRVAEVSDRPIASC